MHHSMQNPTAQRLAMLFVTPALIAEAYTMLADGRDYFPNLRNGLPYGELHGLPDSLMLYYYPDGIWLVAHNDECVMGKATKLVLVATSVAANVDEE